MRDAYTVVNSNTSIDNKPVLQLVQDLSNELAAQGINYCHWKSNANLDRSCSGESDLDLLIGKEDTLKFMGVLTHLGFKQAVLRPGRSIPGVLDFYGCDWKTGRLVHVHTHNQLILGHDATKNYHLPIERSYLDSATYSGLFKVPSVEFELILLVVRLMIKHSTWETVLLRQGKLSASERYELDTLMASASRTKIETLINQHLPVISPRLFDGCMHSLAPGSSLFSRVKHGQQLKHCLDPYSRKSYMIDSAFIFWRRFAWPLEYHLFHIDDRKQMDKGGLLIAIVGGDGAGKTTIIQELSQWLSTEFILYRFHMGKPSWSLITTFIRGFLKIGRSIGFYPFMRSKIAYTKDSSKLDFPGYPWLIREICTGRDRYLTYKKALRIATNGAIVLLDRFPLQQIKFMDGPQVTRMTVNLPQTRLLQYLAALEESFYKKITLPDLVILLNVDPSVASLRKTNEIEEEVRSRTTEIWETDWAESPVIVIDANKSKDEVLNEAKQLIWSRM